MSKQEMRVRLAALSFSEKIKILEKLRDRSLAIAASGLRRKPATKFHAQSGKECEESTNTPESGTNASK
jgi:hypothetical protein